MSEIGKALVRAEDAQHARGGSMTCEANGCTAALPRREVKKAEDAFNPAEHYLCFHVPAGWLVAWVETDGKGRMVVLCPSHGVA